MDDPTLEEIHTTSSPVVGTLGPSGNAPPLDVAHLQQEANEVLGDLLVTKSSIDAHWQKLVSNYGIALCQNKSKTTESIKEAKAQCVHSIKKAEATCAHSIKEAEALCSTAIRKVETWGASQACSIQQSHTKDIQHLEEKSIKEERRDQLNFLSVCQVALKGSPPKSHGVLIAPYPLLQGHAPISNLFNIPPGAALSKQGSI